MSLRQPSNPTIVSLEKCNISKAQDKNVKIIFKNITGVFNEEMNNATS